MQMRPDILVLGGGGVLGEAWMSGVLAGWEDASGYDLRDTGRFLGTSAGSIVAARLAGGHRLRRPEVDPDRLPVIPEVRFRRTMPALVATAAEPVRTLAATLLAPISQATQQVASPVGGVASHLSAPFAAAALGVATPAGALARIAALALLPEARGTLAELREHFDDLGLLFDGRLIVTAVDRANGRRVLFGAPGAPAASVAAAVHASCTVPWLFPPVEIGDGHYIDGGVWSPTNLDAAPVRPGERVLCLNPTAAIRGPHPIFGVARGASRSAMALEAAALRNRGAIVTTVSPTREVAELMGPNLMAAGPRRAVLAAGYRQGLEFAARAG